VDTVEELIGSSRNDANRLHGALLTTKFIVERKLEMDRDSRLGEW